MKRSIATVSLSGTLPEKLEAIAAAGFDGVEIFENDLLYFSGSPADIRQMCADLNLEIMLFQPFRDFEGGPRGRLDRQLDRARRKFELMAELGTDRLLVCSNVSPSTSRDNKLIAEDLHRLAECAAEHNMLVGYEALAWGRHVNTYQQVWNLVRQADHPALGVILDSFHTLSLKGDPRAILSDDALVDLLKARGFDLARRTVAKYREAIGLGSSVQRRRQKALARVK